MSRSSRRSSRKLTYWTDGRKRESVEDDSCLKIEVGAVAEKETKLGGRRNKRMKMIMKKFEEG